MIGLWSAMDSPRNEETKESYYVADDWMEMGVGSFARWFTYSLQHGVG